MFMWIHDLPYCISTPMHQWMDMWIHIHGIKARKENKTLVYHIKGNKQLNRGTETQKHKNEPKQRHTTQGNKEKEAEKLELGFLGWSMCAHT